MIWIVLLLAYLTGWILASPGALQRRMTRDTCVHGWTLLRISTYAIHPCVRNHDLGYSQSQVQVYPRHRRHPRTTRDAWMAILGAAFWPVRLLLLIPTRLIAKVSHHITGALIRATPPAYGEPHLNKPLHRDHEEWVRTGVPVVRRLAR